MGTSQSNYQLKEAGKNVVTYKQAQKLSAHSGLPKEYWLGEDVQIEFSDLTPVVAEDGVTNHSPMIPPKDIPPVKLYEPQEPRVALNQRFAKAVQHYVFHNKTNTRQLAKAWQVNYSVLTAICNGERDVSINYLMAAARHGLFNMNYLFMEYGEMFLPIKRVENLTPTEKALHKENETLRARLAMLEAATPAEKKKAA